MTTDEHDNQGTSDREPSTTGEPESIPIGIARIRDEWRQTGYVAKEAVEPAEEPVEPVLFPEIEGGAGIGDYSLERETVMNRLALSREAMDRLVGSGEIDSIVVQGPDGTTRRLISESSVARFQEDSGIDPEAVARAAKAMADSTVADAIKDLQREIDDLRGTQAKVLQQMKDMLLLEIRNLKEQDRDLTSFVFELVEEVKDALPKKRR